MTFWKENVKKKGSLPEGERIKEKAARSDIPSLENEWESYFFLALKIISLPALNIVNLEEKGLIFLNDYV